MRPHCGRRSPQAKSLTLVDAKEKGHSSPAIGNAGASG